MRCDHRTSERESLPRDLDVPLPPRPITLSLTRLLAAETVAMHGLLRSFMLRSSSRRLHTFADWSLRSEDERRTAAREKGTYCQEQTSAEMSLGHVGMSPTVLVVHGELYYV